mgnify:CR=1 FL=1
MADAPTVVNVAWQECDVYCGRQRGGMHFGNPFTHRPGSRFAVTVVGSVEEAIARYDSWLEGTTDRDVEPERRVWILEAIPLLMGLRLGCHCAPRPCHCNVLARRAVAACGG